MAGYNNPMLSEGAPPMRPWREAGSGCSHNLTAGKIRRRASKKDTIWIPAGSKKTFDTQSWL